MSIEQERVSTRKLYEKVVRYNFREQPLYSVFGYLINPGFLQILPNFSVKILKYGQKKFLA